VERSGSRKYRVNEAELIRKKERATLSEPPYYVLDATENHNQQTAIKRETMDLYPTAETWTGTPGAIAPADGNVESTPARAHRPENLASAADASVLGAQHAAPLHVHAFIANNLKWRAVIQWWFLG